ncbi:Type VI secretion protein [Paraburkholderia unamae]|uniref:type VI secretion protein n=1 Tax=Paraburkholderia unamae TaxID=219649 RepID=UPI001CAF2CDD|nr:type VI secretion protein [Paraburkholderia unamae]CAG9254962.1 Type VI secretion protein [Paraburkholderia unamae]
MRKHLLRAALAAGLAIGACQSALAFTVFDPTNFVKNTITAAEAVKGEIYQDTNIVYQYQMMANQLLQATNLNPVAMKAAYDEITGDISKARSLTTTLTSLYGSLKQGSEYITHVQNLISTSGKSPTQWLSDMNALLKQNDSTAKNLFQMGNDVMQHTQDLAQRRADLQSQLSLSPTQQATAELTTHYLDIVTSQNADLLNMMASKTQADAQKQAADNISAEDRASAAQSFTAEQDAERAALDALPRE